MKGAMGSDITEWLFWVWLVAGVVAMSYDLWWLAGLCAVGYVLLLVFGKSS